MRIIFIYRAFLYCSLSCAAAASARAQDLRGGAIGAAAGGAYIYLSWAALGRLFRGPVEAHAGDTVRVALHDARSSWTETGRFDAIDADSITLIGPTGGRMRYARHDVDELSAYRGMAEGTSIRRHDNRRRTDGAAGGVSVRF